MYLEVNGRAAARARVPSARRPVPPHPGRSGRRSGRRPDPQSDPQSDRKSRRLERQLARRQRRRAATITALSAVLVVFALLVPNQLGRLTPPVFLRVPAEGLVAAAAVLVLPDVVRRRLMALVGVLLGLLTVGKLFDLGFFEVLYRPFNVVSDWTFLANGLEFLTSSLGRVTALAIAAGAVLLALAIVVLTTLSTLRLSRILARNTRPTAISCGLLATVWAAGAVLGVQTAPGEPFAAAESYHAAVDRVRQIGAAREDQAAFAAQLGTDPFRDTPADQLLTGLKGKDVVVAFVESYGRVCFDDPQLSRPLSALLTDGDRSLREAGFSARSAFVTSPTFGGGSWLAQSTVLSGVWTDNQQRYEQLVASDRLTLNGAFHRAGWRTVGVVPGVTRAWPESSFFTFDRYYDARHLGYAGPRFSWSPIPDQYTLEAFQRLERGRKNRQPLMAEIPLTSSHIPWTPLPKMVDWNAVGDGSVYRPMAVTTESTRSVLQDPAKARAAYLNGVAYSINSLLSYVTRYGDDNLVLVFLGDHQPSSIVTGQGARRDAPITIVAKDPAVLDRVAGWRWTDGLAPAPDAPVWRMDTFRDRFLTAFGSTPAAPAATGQPGRPGQPSQP